MINPFTKAGRERISDRRPRRYRGYKSVSELEGAQVDWGTAMSQAVVALDHAAHLAKKTKSSAGMREVAIGWLAVAESMNPRGGQDDDDGEFSDVGDSDENDEVYPIGFRGVEPEEEYNEEEDDYDEESRSSRTKHQLYTTPRGFPLG